MKVISSSPARLQSMKLLPKRFKKIRYFGFLSPRYKKDNIKIIRKFVQYDCQESTTKVDESLKDMMLRLTDIDITTCPKCGQGRMARIIKLLRNI